MGNQQSIIQLLSSVLPPSPEPSECSIQLKGLRARPHTSKSISELARPLSIKTISELGHSIKTISELGYSQLKRSQS